MSLPGVGYLAAGSLLLAIAAGAGGYFHGLEVGRDRAERKQNEAIASANAERDRLRVRMEQTSHNHLLAEQARETTQREIIRESVKILDRPVYRNIVADDDGVRLLDRAADNANAKRAGASADPAG